MAEFILTFSLQIFFFTPANNEAPWV